MRSHWPAIGVCLLLAACGDSDSDADGGTDAATASEDGGTDAGPSAGDDGGTGSVDDGTDGEADDDDGSDGDTDTSSGGVTEPPPPSAACDDVQLPERTGAEIVVSPGGDGMVMVDGAATTLRAVVSGASSGDTILLEDGTYTFAEAGEGSYSGLYFTQPDVTLRSASGDASAVDLDSRYLSHGGSSATVTIAATGIVIADITVRRSIFHLIHLWAEGDGALIHNVHMIDGGQQFLKASPGEGTVDDVEVSCSTFLMTDEGRDNVWGYGPQDGSTQCYTGGIDTHDSRDWVVHDSYFDGIYCDATGVQRPAHGQFPELRDGMTYNGGLAEHGVHMWESAEGSGHVIARNRIVNCARGIGVGFVDPVYGSSVVNNMVFSEHPGSGQHDVGISVERAVDTLVAHNTVYFSHPDSYGAGIEYRWDTTTNLTMHGNLTNREIRARNDAVATTSDNVMVAEDGWFVDGANGDLHLADCSAAGEAMNIDGVGDDFDSETRADPTSPGADECAR